MMYNCVVCGDSVDDAVLKGLFADWESLVMSHVCSPRCHIDWGMVEKGFVLPEHSDELLPPAFPVADEPDEFDKLRMKVTKSLALVQAIVSGQEERMNMMQRQIDALLIVVEEHLKTTQKYLEIMDREIKMLEQERAL
jgi:hypothetical protein